MVHKKFTTKTENFFAGKLIYIIVFSILLITSLLQIITFIFFNQGISIYWDNFGDDNQIYFGDPNTWIIWIILVISFFGYFSTFIGFILLLNFNKKFIYFSIIGELFLIAFNLIIGIFFTLITNIFYIIIPLINYQHWNDNSEQEFNKELDWTDKITHILFTIIYIAVGIPIALLLLNENIKYGIADVIGSSLLISGWYLTTKKSRWGFIEFIITDFIYIFIFIVVNSWVSLVSYILYLLFDLMILIMIWDVFWPNWPDDNQLKFEI